MKSIKSESSFIKSLENQILNINCYEHINLLDDKSIDVLVTDPPYGIDVIKGKTFGSIGGNNAAKVQIYRPIVGDDTKVDFKELFRVSKNQVIFGGNYFSELPISSGWIVWDKKKKDDWWDNFSDGELIWTSYNRPLRIKRHLYMGCIQEGKREKKQHPTQKPLELMKWIIEHYTNEDDLILDPFAGVGSTLIACKLLNRRYIGFEIDKHYFNVAKKRLMDIDVNDKERESG